MELYYKVRVSDIIHFEHLGVHIFKSVSHTGIFPVGLSLSILVCFVELFINASYFRSCWCYVFSTDLMLQDARSNLLCRAAGYSAIIVVLWQQSNNAPVFTPVIRLG